MKRKYLRGAALFCCLAVGQTSFAKQLFKFKNKEMHDTDLSTAIQQELVEADEQHYKNVKRITDQYVLEQYFAGLHKGKTAEQSRTEFFSKINVSDADVKKFYTENQHLMQGRKLEDLKLEIARHLKQEKASKAMLTLVQDLEKKGTYQFLMPKVVHKKAEINVAGFPSKGSNTAPITVVEFADFNCGHCRHASETLEKIVSDKELKGKVKVVYLDYPLDPQGLSSQVSKGGVCADEQGKFWLYHNLAFNQQGKMSAETPKTLAREIGLDIGKFDTCMQSAEAERRVSMSRQRGEEVGVRGTPTLYINGFKHTAGYGFDELKEAIKKYM